MAQNNQNPTIPRDENGKIDVYTLVEKAKRDLERTRVAVEETLIALKELRVDTTDEPEELPQGEKVQE